MPQAKRATKRAAKIGRIGEPTIFGDLSDEAASEFRIDEPPMRYFKPSCANMIRLRSCRSAETTPAIDVAISRRAHHAS
ncbi:MAG: hypothetical protein AB7U61_14660 [Methylocystis sp.]